MLPRGAILKFFGQGLLLLCLFAPSAWMIATIPPLWRDADAYVQATEDPLVATFWGHAPAYCFVAKVPLFAGEQLERWQGNAPARRANDLSQPGLTDSGTWLLIIGQHLALCGAAFYFIVVVSKLFWVRLALTLAWASNALFYTFSHCIGSETLSMILIVLLVGKALRLVQSRREPRWVDWYVFALILCLCFLSRHLNLLLISLLPAAFLLSWAQSHASVPFASGGRKRLWLRRVGARDLRQAVIAIAIGLACFAVASYSIQGLARKSRFHPHSRMGFTFLWRLHFLETLSPESRLTLLRKVTARTHSTEVRGLIALREQMHADGADLTDPGPFLQRAIQLFHGPLHWEELDHALNKMAFAFLLPPTREHLQVARTDFVMALKMPLSDISSFLFATTSYYFQHQDEMPACAKLVTFRDANADLVSLIPSQRLYFRLWQGLSYNKALVIWFVTLLAFVIVTRRKKVNVRTTSAFGIALTAVGLLITAATCLLDEYGTRFGLPMWELLLLSLYIFAGKTADLFGISGFRGFARPAIGFETVRRAALPRKRSGLPKLG